MTRGRYASVREWILQHPQYLKLLRFLYRLPLLLYAAYPMMLFGLLVQRKWAVLLRAAIVPLAVFLGVTLLRHWHNAPRPYEVWDIPPLFPKSKKGHSFPSRHSTAASVIAMAFWFISPAAGAVVLAIALLIAASRVLAGVHFVRDVLAGLAAGILGGIIGFFIV